MDDKAIPETRQCQDREHWQFGSVAVKAGDNRWLIGNPTNGAHWGGDADVADWHVGMFE